MKAFSLFVVFSLSICPNIMWTQLNQPDAFLVETEEGHQIDCQGSEMDPAAIKQMNETVYRMKSDGSLEKKLGRSLAHPLFIWPMKQAPGFNDPGFYTVVTQVDLDPSTNWMDYNCLGRTYDGHKGTDIRAFPWHWKKLNENHIEAIAAADGVIINKVDGMNDQCNGNGSWNCVYLVHADGSKSYYGHLKKNSTTPKDTGDVVVAGEYLGTVGSSGTSQRTHLHFEVYDASGNIVDPWVGTCNGTTPDSWWQDQLPYYNSGVNKLTTHEIAPFIPPCPAAEITNEKTVFQPGDSIKFTVSIRHSLTTDSAQLKVYEPDGDLSNILNLTYMRNGNFFVEGVNPIFFRLLSNSAELGKWTFQVKYFSSSTGMTTCTKNFWVSDCETNLTLSGTHADDYYYQATGIINSAADIPNNREIHYDAGTRTILNPGFLATAGCIFEVKHNGCY